MHSLFSPKLQVSRPVKEICVTGRVLLDDVFNVVGFLRLPELLASRKVLELRFGDVPWGRDGECVGGTEM